MTPTIRSAQAARTIDDRTAEALHTLADMWAAGSIPERTDPFAVSILILVSTARDVREFSERFGIEAYGRTAGNAAQTCADLPIGEGGDSDASYPNGAGAVVLSVVHIADPS